MAFDTIAWKKHWLLILLTTKMTHSEEKHFMQHFMWDWLWITKQIFKIYCL